MKIKDLKRGDKIRCGVTLLRIEYVDYDRERVRVINLLTHQHAILPESAIKHMKKAK